MERKKTTPKGVAALEFAGVLLVLLPFSIYLLGAFEHLQSKQELQSMGEALVRYSAVKPMEVQPGSSRHVQVAHNRLQEHIDSIVEEAEEAFAKSGIQPAQYYFEAAYAVEIIDSATGVSQGIAERPYTYLASSGGFQPPTSILNRLSFAAAFANHAAAQQSLSGPSSPSLSAVPLGFHIQTEQLSYLERSVLIGVRLFQDKSVSPIAWLDKTDNSCVSSISIATLRGEIEQ